MGEHCTARAVQERIKKLRKDAKAGFDPSSPAAVATSGRASPAKTTPSKITKAKKVPAVKTKLGKKAPGVKTEFGGKAAKGKAGEENTNDEEREEDDVVEEEETKEPARKVRFLAIRTPDSSVIVLIITQKRKYMQANAAGASASEPEETGAEAV